MTMLDTTTRTTVIRSSRGRLMSGPVDSPTPRKSRGIGRRVWRIARWPLALLLAAFLGFVAINAFDDKLSPLAQSMLRTPDNPYSDEQNLYVLLAGIEAPPGESMLERGQRNLREASAQLATERAGADGPLKGITPATEAIRVDFGSWNPPPDRNSVWDSARTGSAKIQSLALQNRELLARLESLHKTTGYVETLRLTPRTPMYSMPVKLRILYLTDVARRIQSGNRPEQGQALLSLRQDMDMWQRMLQGEGTLLSKMLAQSYIHDDLLLLSDAIADTSVPLAVVAANSGPWLESMSVDEWKIGKVFVSEFRFGAGVFQSLHEQHSVVDRLFFLPDATMNAMAEQLHVMQLLADGEPGQMRGREKATLSDRREEAASFPGVLRNPMGKILLRISASAYSEYPLRVFDVAALQRAVTLAYQIRANRIARTDVEAFMQAHPEWSTHPVGNARFDWNEDAMELHVPQQERAQNSRRFSVRVARINPP
jgi:hypothetical protein